MNTFENSSFLVVGASGGMGQALCAKLHQQGAKLFLIGRDEAKLKPIADKYSAQYAIAEASNFKQLEEAASQASAQMGSFDGLVNLAGSLLLKPSATTSEQELDAVMKANFYTAFSLTRLAPKLIKKEGGSVVLISSVAAKIGLSSHEAIASAKAAVMGLTLSSAASYARANIRVNAIAPGLVDTPLTQSLTTNDLMRKASEAMHPLGRIGQPEHIAEAILFLLNPTNNWITGEMISVDGGMGNLKLAVKA